MVKVRVICSGVGTPFQNSAKKTPPKNLAQKNRSEKNRLGKNLVA